MLKPSLSQACPDLLAAGGEHVVVQFHFLMMWKGNVTIQSGLDRLSLRVGPTFPKVNPEQKSNDKFPHYHLILGVSGWCEAMCNTLV